MVESLRQGLSPFQRPLDFWQPSSAEGFIDWLQHLAGQVDRFKGMQREASVSRLRQHQCLARNQLQITELKAQLLGLSSTESSLTMKILKAIQKLQIEQKEIVAKEKGRQKGLSVPR
jgi:hypothetical protein